jgi:hypothetical protein
MNRTKKKREIKYPKLYECSQIEQDDYWKQFFENLSRGKSIKKLLLSDGTIELIQKNKNIVYVYRDKHPELILSEAKDLIRQKLHIHSKRDIVNSQHVWSTEQNELNTLTQQDDWKKIRNKNMRYFLIMKYSIYVKHKKNLSWNVANILFKTIKDAFYNIHTHKSVDVYMQNSEIIDIKDIIITDDHIVRNNRIESLESKKEKKDTKASLWDKYLNNVVKMAYESKMDALDMQQKQQKEEEEEMFPSVLDDDDDYETINAF